MRIQEKSTENRYCIRVNRKRLEQPIVMESDIVNGSDSSNSSNSYVVLQDDGQQKTVNIDPTANLVISANNLPVMCRNFISTKLSVIWSSLNAIKEVENATSQHIIFS